MDTGASVPIDYYDSLIAKNSLENWVGGFENAVSYTGVCVCG